VQVAPWLKVRPVQVSAVRLNPLDPSIVSVIGPASLGLTLVTVNVVDVPGMKLTHGPGPMPRREIPRPATAASA